MDMRHGYENGVLRDDSVYVTNASTQLLYCLVLAMCEQYHAARRYAIRCLRRVVRFDPATICLALTFVFLSTAGAVAQTAALVAQAGPDQPTVVSGKEVQLDGTGSTVTYGSRTVTYDWERTGGTMGGSVTLTAANTLQPSFTPTALDPGAAAVTHIFTLTVTDNLGSTAATDMVMITVTAPPIAVPGFDQRVPPGWPVVLDGSRSVASAGNRISEYTWFSVEVALECDEAPKHTIEGSLAKFTAEDLAPGAADVTYCFFLVVEQSNGDQSAYVGPLKVTVTNSEDPYEPPVAKIAGGDRSVASGGTVTLNGIHSTFDSRTSLTWRWARTGGTSTATGILTGETRVHRIQVSFTVETLTAGVEDVTHILTLTVTDFQGRSSTATVTITVTAALVANAGPDQPTIFSGETVTLDGSRSTASGGGRIVTYAWTRAGGTGSAVKLSDTTVVDPTFTPTLDPGDAPVTYIFTLTVTDDAGSTAVTDTVTITVRSATADPVAQAGDDESVGSGGTVTLNGSRSTVDFRRSIRLFSWARTGGTSTATGTLTGATTATPSFTAETLTPGAADVTHILTLTVTDGLNVTATDTVTITVTSALVANAGPDQPRRGQPTIFSGETVTLDGGRSTASGGGRNVTYAWTQASGSAGGTGSAVNLSNTTVVDPTFTAQTLNPGDASVTYIFTLTVTDSEGGTDTDTVTITVKAPPFGNLVAEAGPDQDNVGSGTQVTLDGSGSTPTGSGRNVTYAWTQTGGTTVTLSNTTVLDPTFTAQTLNPGDADVTYEFTLTVTDDKGSTDATDTVTITVKAPPFGNLVAEAGPDQDNVGSGTQVTLDGSGSTPTGSGRNVTYAWTQTGGTTVTLSNTTVLDPTFTAQTLNPGDADVTYEFTLTVTDDKGSTDATDTVTITVKAPPFGKLVAEAGTGGSVDSGTRNVELDGTGSTETVGVRTVTYAWARTGGTGDDTVAPSNPAALQTSFTAETLNPGDASVTHIFTLTVTDNQGSTQATDTVTFTVLAPLVAEAGPNKTVASGGTVTLNGSTQTDSTRTVTYAWTRTSGTGGSLTGETTAAPTFTAHTLTPGAASVDHVFTLTVSDDQSSTPATDTVTVTVTASPVAVPGRDQRVPSGWPVVLDGSGSMAAAGNTISEYFWYSVEFAPECDPFPPHKIDGSFARFTAEVLAPRAADVTYCFFLIVKQSNGDESAPVGPLKVTVTNSLSSYVRPVAKITGGDRSVASGASVQLDGRSSTHDNRTTVTYDWERTGGTSTATGTLTGEDTAMPSFMVEPLTDGAEGVTHILTLTVTDSQGGSSTATVTITVTAPLAALVAEAGTGQTVDSGARDVPLDGTGSTLTGGGRTVTYLWTRTGGTGDSSVAPSDPAALQTSFTAETLNPGDADVTHIFTLRVTDDQSSTDATDTVTFTVTAPLAALVAEAGTGQTVDSGARDVPLDGTGSTLTGGGRTVTYLWTRTGGTGDSSVAPSDPAALQTSFTAETLNPGDADVTHIFTLRVTDDQSSTDATDTVTFTVTAPLAALVAEAGTGQTVDSGARDVPLDGTGSTLTGGGRNVTYLWTRTGGDGDSSVAPSDPAALQTSFTAETLNPGDASVTHIFTLRVTDDQSSTAATDTVTFTVTAPLAALVAEAGTGQTVDSGARDVPLDGTGSTLTGGGRTVTYLWTRTGGDRRQFRGTERPGCAPDEFHGGDAEPRRCRRDPYLHVEGDG